MLPAGKADGDRLAWAALEAGFLSTWDELPETRDRGLSAQDALQEVGSMFWMLR
jgi:hypothetical protein